MPTAALPKISLASKQDTEIDRQLAVATRRIRTHDLFCGSLTVAAIALGYFAVVIALDRWLDLPSWVRQVGIIGLLGSLAAASYYLVVRPWRRAVNPLYAAKQVEDTVADAKNSIVNWVDLQEKDLSDGVRAVVSAKAAKQMKEADLDRAGESKRLLWLGGSVGTLFVVLAILFLIFKPSVFLSLFHRAWNPFASASTIATRTQIRLVEPKDGDLTITAGQPLLVSVTIEGRIPNADSPDRLRVQLRHNPADPNYEEIALEQTTSNRDWTVRIPEYLVQNGFWYRVAGGDAVTSEYRVTVRPKPMFTEFDVKYEYPAYLRMKSDASKDPHIEAYRGTIVTITAKANRELKDGRASLRDVAQPIIGEILSESRDTLRVKMTLAEAGSYRLLFHSTTDEANNDAPPYEIRVQSDQPPTAIITDPKEEEIMLPANGLLKVDGLLTDDFGIDKATLRLRIAAAPEKPGFNLAAKAFLKGKSFQRETDGTFPREVLYKDSFSLADAKDEAGKAITLNEGMVVEYWLEATDNCTVPKANLGKSRVQKVRLTAAKKEPMQKDELKQQAENRQKDEANQQKQEQQKRDAEKRPENKNEKKEKKEEQQKDPDNKQEKKEDGEPGEKDEGQPDPNQKGEPKPGDKPMKGDGGQAAPMSPMKADDKTPPMPMEKDAGKPEGAPSDDPPKTDTPEQKGANDKTAPKPKKGEEELQREADRIQKEIDEQDKKPGEAKPNDQPQPDSKTPAAEKKPQPKPEDGAGGEDKKGEKEPMAGAEKGAGSPQKPQPTSESKPMAGEKPEASPQEKEPPLGGKAGSEKPTPKPEPMKPEAGEKAEDKPGEPKGADGQPQPEAKPGDTPPAPKNTAKPAEAKKDGQTKPAEAKKSEEPSEQGADEAKDEKPGAGREQKPTPPANSKKSSKPDADAKADSKPMGEPKAGESDPTNDAAKPKEKGKAEPDRSTAKKTPASDQKPDNAKSEEQRKADAKEIQDAAKDLAGNDEKKKQAARDKLDEKVGKPAREEAEKLADDLKSDDPVKKKAAEEKLEKLQKEAEKAAKNAEKPDNAKSEEQRKADAKEIQDAAKDLAGNDEKKKQAARDKLDEKVGKPAREQAEKDLKSGDPAKQKAAEEKLQKEAEKAAKNAEKPDNAKSEEQRKADTKEIQDAAKDLASNDEKKKQAARDKLDEKVGKPAREQAEKDMKSGDPAKQKAAEEKLQKDAEEKAKQNKDNQKGQPADKPMSPQEAEELAKDAEDLKSPDAEKRKQAEKKLDEKIGKEAREQLQKQNQEGKPQTPEQAKKQLEEMAKKQQNPPQQNPAAPQNDPQRDPRRDGNIAGTTDNLSKPLEENPEFKKKSAQLQLETLKKNKLNAEMQKKLGYTEEEYQRFLEGYEKMLQDREAQATNDAPTVAGKANPVAKQRVDGTTKVEARKDASSANPNSAGSAFAPSAYTEAQKKFAEAAAKNKRDENK